MLVLPGKIKTMKYLRAFGIRLNTKLTDVPLRSFGMGGVATVNVL